MNFRALNQTILSLLVVIVACFQSADAANFVNISKTADETRNINAKLVVNAPPSFVWQTLTNYSALQSYVPGYKKSQVISDNGPSSVVAIKFKPGTFLPDYNYKVNISENRRNMSVDIRKISGDFKTLVGHYELKSIDNGNKTLIVHRLKINTGSNLPGTTSVLKSSSEKALVALKKQSERYHQKSIIGQK